MEDRLAQILAAWARPLVSDGIGARLSPRQLYAVVLAPAISATLVAGDPATNDSDRPLDWFQFLANLALAAIAPQKDEPK